MKRHPFFLREVHRTLCIGSSNSTPFISVASLIFLVLAISCGPAPKGQYHVPETAIAAAAKTMPEPSMQTAENLPESAAVNFEADAPTSEIFLNSRCVLIGADLTIFMGRPVVKCSISLLSPTLRLMC